MAARHRLDSIPSRRNTFRVRRMFEKLPPVSMVEMELIP